MGLFLSKEKATSMLQSSAGNLLYCFIDMETQMPYLGRNALQNARIRSKRKEQITFVSKIAQQSGYSTTECYSIIRSAINSVYGMEPEYCIQKLALGEAVAGKNWAAGIYGIGSTTTTGGVTTEVISDPGAVSRIEAPNVGLTIDASKEVPTIVGYKNQTIYNNDGTQTKFVYDQKNNSTYTVTRDQSGNIIATTAQDTTTEATKRGRFWENLANCLPVIGKFLQWILSLFGVKNPQTFAPDQIEDGWAAPTQAGGMWLGIAAAGLLGYAAYSSGILDLSGSGSKKKKKKK